MTFLSRKLENYYRRDGNRFRFKNNRSLNELAMEMWEKLHYRQMDPSILSKVVNGKKLFSLKQLNIFCDILKISSKERKTLQRLLMKDLMISKGFSIEQNVEIENSNQFLIRLLYMSETLRINGHPHNALALFQHIIPSEQNKKLFIRFLNEKARLYGETAFQKQTIGQIKKLNEQSFELAKDIKQQHVLEMAYVTYGGALYLEEKWKESSEFLELHYRSVSKHTKMEFLRTLLLDYAHLQNEQQFKVTFKKAIYMLEKYGDTKNDFIASLLESIIRSLTILDLTNEARTFFPFVNAFEVSPFYKAQLMRGKAYVLHHEAKQKKKFDKYEFLTHTSDIFTEKFAPYERHRNQIKTIQDSFF